LISSQFQINQIRRFFSSPPYTTFSYISTKTKARSPQTNGLCERFHKAILQEFYQLTSRKKIYSEIETLLKDLDKWIDEYNNERTHQGKMRCGRAPIVTLEMEKSSGEDGKELWKEKFVNRI